jgi:transposase
MPTSWPSSPAPTCTASRHSGPTATRRRRCAPWPGRARTWSVEQKVALANQLRAQLDVFWPGAKRIFAEVDSPIALAFFERYPSPTDARSLGVKRLASFLARNGYSGRRAPEELLDRLRSAPEGRAGEAELEARRQIVLALVAALKPLVEQIKLLTSQIAGAVRAHDDGHIFLSLFRDPKSVVTAAELLAEIGDNRDRHLTSSSLEAIAGQAPVAVQSGKHKVARFRWACNKNLRTAVGVLADASRHHNPWAADIYQRARARGHDHPHAIRILGRAWLRII